MPGCQHQPSLSLGPTSARLTAITPSPPAAPLTVHICDGQMVPWLVNPKLANIKAKFHLDAALAQLMLLVLFQELLDHRRAPQNIIIINRHHYQSYLTVLPSHVVVCGVAPYPTRNVVGVPTKIVFPNACVRVSLRLC